MPKGVYDHSASIGAFQATKLHPAAHRYVKQLHGILSQERCTLKTLSERTGIHYDTVRKWFKGERNPRVFELEAAFNACDYKMPPAIKIKSEYKKRSKQVNHG